MTAWWAAYFTTNISKHQLVAQAQLGAGQRVLDVGCATASLTVLIKQRQTDTQVVGLDADPKVLALARAKAEQAGVEITFDRGMAFELPYSAGSFDRVFSSLVFHHLTRPQKLLAAREIARVLRPGGQLHLADFGPPHTALMRLVSLMTAQFEEVADNFRGLLGPLLREAGLVEIIPTARYTTFFGTLMLWAASRSVT